MTRWRVACDTCEVVFESGPGPDGAVAAWCEACQAQAADGATACAACGDPLTRGAPGFLSIYGLVQDLSAVIEAWNGAPDGLARLLPERPRWLTDLTPPDPITAPDAPTRSVLERLAAGAFTEVAAKLAPLGDAAESPALVWTARAIARERRHDPEGAEHDWSRVLAAGEDARARLARGALRARRRDWKGARVDLQQAGDRFEARWDRAALALAEPVDVAPGAMPSAEIIGAARAEAGVPSDYWSDHTVGRLLWSLVLERALAREGGPTAADEDALRTAAGEFELARVGEARYDGRGHRRGRVADSAGTPIDSRVTGGSWAGSRAHVVRAGASADRDRRPGCTCCDVPCGCTQASRWHLGCLGPSFSMRPVHPRVTERGVGA